MIGPHAERIPRPRLDAISLAIDDEEQDVGLVLRAGRARLHHVIIRLARARGERLLGIDQIVLAVARGFGEVVPPVPAGGAFAGRIGAEQAAIVRLQPTLLLVGAAEQVDGLGRADMHHVDEAGRGIGLPDAIGGLGEVDMAEAEAAVLHLVQHAGPAGIR
ncbi:hypothetical protein ACVWZ3_007175 [Bradyrhizobium sp. i1.3.6]